MTPPHWQLRADARLRRREQGRVLIGGTPLGIIRLSERGARIATDLFAGKPIGDDPAQVTLAERLLDRGMAHPNPPSSAHQMVQQLCIIIPVRNDPGGLQRTLLALGQLALIGRIVVVDDGSSPPLRPEWLQECIPGSPIELLRNSVSLGPGAARNVGLAHVGSSGDLLDEILWFCDAGVEIDPDSIGPLLAHFERARVVAVAPRITVRKPAGPSATLDRYEQRHSPLDLGPLPSPVRPGAPVSYVPTACLLVRRAALREVGPFDPDLRFGEDVDLIWRLCEVGDIRYEPQATAMHPRRNSVRALARQRFHYGSAAGPLGKRHGQAVTPLRTSAQTFAILGLALTGHAVLASMASAATAKALAPKLGDLEDRGVEAVRFTATGVVTSGVALARAGTRAWWPLLAIAGLVGPSRGFAKRWAAMSLVERAINERTLDPRQLGVSVLDDLSYGTGVWFGAVRARTVAPIAPVVSRARGGR